MVTVIRADKIKEDTLEDKDSDTKVTVEESSDEDKIRFDTAGSERMIITETGAVGIGTTTPIAKLDVAGKIAITSEVSTPLAPADGKGWLYTKSDGKLYWQSNDISETDLTSGGGGGSGDITSVVAGVGLSGGATSGDATLTVDFSEFSDVTPVNGDKLATLDSDGSTEQLTTIASLATLFAGTASSTGLSASSSVLSVSDLHPVGVDGSANQLLTDDGDGTMTSESKALIDGAKITIGNGTAEDTLLVFDGNAADFRIGIDDDSDTMEIGAGAAHDTTAAIVINSSGHVTKIGQDSPSSDEVLTWDGSKAVWSAAGGGSSSDTFNMFQQIEQTLNLSTSYYYYKNVTGGYGWTNNFSPSSFSTSFPYWRIHRYASSGTVPVDCTMTKYRIVGHKDGSDNDTITIKIWKVPAATHGDAETDTPTLVEVVSVEINADANEIVNKNAAISSNNSFSAGDSWFVTIAPTSSYMTSDHYLQLSVEFTVS